MLAPSTKRTPRFCVAAALFLFVARVRGTRGFPVVEGFIVAGHAGRCDGGGVVGSCCQSAV